jgi:hypothetical protein
MNTLKFTTDTKRELLSLYKIGLPTVILAKLFEVATATVIKNLPKEAKENAQYFKEPNPQKRLELLKLYAWLIADEKECAIESQTFRITKAAPLLFEYLRLKEWQRVLDGAVASYNLANQNRFHESVPEGYQRLINDLVPALQIKVRGKALLAEALTHMHSQTIPFPEVEDISNPIVALTGFLQERFICNETFARYYDQVFVDRIELVLSGKSERKRLFLKAAYGIGDTTTGQLLDRYNLGPASGDEYKRRAFNSVQLYILRDLQNPLAASITQRKLVIEAEETKQTTARELALIQKTSSRDISSLQEKLSKVCKAVAGKVSIPEHIAKIIKSYVGEIPELDSSLKKILETPLEDLDLSVRAFNCLKASKINSLRELVQYDVEELKKFRNFGQKSLSEIDQLLQEKGLSFGMVIA